MGERAWLIYFDDAARDVEVFVGAGAETAARSRSEQVGQAWTHTLFVDAAALAACLTAVETERDEALAALKDEMQWDGPENMKVLDRLRAERDEARKALAHIEAVLTLEPVHGNKKALRAARAALPVAARSEIKQEGEKDG